MILDMLKYGKFLGAGGGNGGGIQIKKAVFTDRPTLHTFLQSNFAHIQKALFVSGGYENTLLPMTKINGETTYSFVYFQGQDLASANQISLDIAQIDVGDSYTYTSNIAGLRGDENGLLGNGNAVTTVPDAYWAAMGISVTIYYYSE